MLRGFYSRPKYEEDFYKHLKCGEFWVLSLNRGIAILNTQTKEVKEIYTLKEWYDMFDPVSVKDVLNEFLGK